MYEVIDYHHLGIIDGDNKTTNNEVMTWDIDRSQALKTEISLSTAQLYRLSIFKKKIMNQTKLSTNYQKNEASSECDIQEDNETSSECDPYGY